MTTATDTIRQEGEEPCCWNILWVTRDVRMGEIDPCDKRGQIKHGEYALCFQHEAVVQNK